MVKYIMTSKTFFVRVGRSKKNVDKLEIVEMCYTLNITVFEFMNLNSKMVKV